MNFINDFMTQNFGDMGTFVLIGGPAQGPAGEAERKHSRIAQHRRQRQGFA